MKKVIEEDESGYVEMGDCNVYVIAQRKKYKYFVGFPDGDFVYIDSKDSMDKILDTAYELWLTHYRKRNKKEFVEYTIDEWAKLQGWW